MSLPRWLISTNDACLGKFSSQALDPSPIHAHVGPAEAGRGADADHAPGGVELKFEVIDEAQDRAATFGVQIARFGSNDPGSGHGIHRSAGSLPRLLGIALKAQGFDKMTAPRCIAAHAIRGGRTIGQFALAYAKIPGASARTGKKPHHKHYEYPPNSEASPEAVPRERLQTLSPGELPRSESAGEPCAPH